ncbi:hypothetical protein PISMIDRAFT_14588 [Pisolithus microcarpus 441]|uniref:Uncharacterized protein n=1 Tax=Pisolithus microcarpus 441 TaxID=765257 RepID=A0A0C9Y040_9AGAM|nr:hypothetical protein PISMIDRAFT_14588 [Pisolithus microcarpus 441]
MDLLEEEDRIMGECLISDPTNNNNNNSNNLLMERAKLVVVMVVVEDYDQGSYDQEESGQYDDQYDQGYESYNVEITALDVSTANHLEDEETTNRFKEFEDNITPVPVLYQEPVDQPSSSSVTTEYSHSWWNSNSGEDQQVMNIC